MSGGKWRRIFNFSIGLMIVAIAFGCVFGWFGVNVVHKGRDVELRDKDIFP
jgi:hypothetical protein